MLVYIWLYNVFPEHGDVYDWLPVIVLVYLHTTFLTRYGTGSVIRSNRRTIVSRCERVRHSCLHATTAGLYETALATVMPQHVWHMNLFMTLSHIYRGSISLAYFCNSSIIHTPMQNVAHLVTTYPHTLTLGSACNFIHIFI